MRSMKCFEGGLLNCAQHGEEYPTYSLIAIIPRQYKLRKNFNLGSVPGGDDTHIISGGNHFSQSGPDTQRHKLQRLSAGVLFPVE